MKNYKKKDTICALATGSGLGAIAIIRVSGSEAINICKKVFSKNIADVKSHTIHFGTINDKVDVIDEVLLSIFRNPHSFTGEDVIEISCHSSVFIQQKILQLLIENGSRMANPGEFTLRAFTNGKMDLSQAEAVADLIASESKKAHQIAINQMRGGFSNDLKILREHLINFAALIELELDFSEEDVEFANREQFNQLLLLIKEKLTKLIDSFHLGNVIKNGIPVTILGAPNVGKSTLLNVLVNEDRAIVSEIAGTTRDTIEDVINIEGMQFRFIDTAGLRDTKDTIEKIGIQKALEKAEKAKVIIYLLDATTDFKAQEKEIGKIKKLQNKMIVVVNKTDLNPNICETLKKKNYLFISAKNKDGIEDLTKTLISIIDTNLSSDETIISNSRHKEELSKTLVEIIAVMEGLNNGISGDLLAINIRQALHHLGLITGEVTIDDLLGNIFSKFCIGK
ncbi:MAG TPA: tRNA uridine-5-carboxymethylaminomethyl(34) synthesis GTPase MnmE [Flavobacteriales bacterium]|jgi:tRNA modification GTPase|nr:tRNA uridine-5-carboxymethylaminomethyl(34) synthesis GTPase MnmE [Flavobacteriales bacterium]HJN63173.1 tRNA uridine-5-carboxymethylaminomethyl(34) synthesis GTPase MnmE [Flavobacteriales bacterium]|tara:strand:+ start:100 stop:1458 length:1359 start_codon:yes stop_codon:yes gene_type:complete